MTNYIFYILTIVLIFAVLGVTFNLIMGYAGIISVAHAAYFGVGAYTTALLELRLGWPFLAALLVSIVVAGVVGAIFIRIIAKVRGDYMVVITLGIQLVFISALINLTGITNGNVGLLGVPRPELFGFQFDSTLSYALLTLLICAILLGVAWWISRSPFGKSLKALREDEIGAQSLGKNIFKDKVTVFVVSSALAGAAGSLYAPFQMFINPSNFSLWESIICLVIVIVGGAGNLWGSVVGAVILVTIPEALRFIPVTSGATAQIREFLFGVVLLFMVFFRPQGIFGEYRFGAKVIREKEDSKQKDIITEFQYQPSVVRVEDAETEIRLSNNGKPILQVLSLSKNFTGIRAVDDVSFSITPEKKVVGIIGPNGAGKSTLFDLICGYTKADTGTVYFKGQNVTKLAPFAKARLGIGRSFQGLRLFGRMTVLDNVIVAIQPPQKEENIFHTFNPNMFKQTKLYRDEALKILEDIGLASISQELTEDLSYAEQKLLVLARLLAVKSELLLLDELASGLDQESMVRLARLVRQLSELGHTVCLVEHSLDFVRHAVDTILFLDQGRMIAEGPTGEIIRDPKLSQIYFGSIA